MQVGSEVLKLLFGVQEPQWAAHLGVKAKNQTISKEQFMYFAENLSFNWDVVRSEVNKLLFRVQKAEWSDYLGV